jgi:cytochrome c oxidase cbb3-type subunit I/II
MTTGTTDKDRFHRRVLEGKAGIFALATTVVILIGGIVEIIPMFTRTAGPERPDWVSPYTPLEVAGRDIYIREGCYVCHSQMVRPMRAELLRYGEWTRAGEYRYDHPFLLGSRRIGPDLQRLGGRYPDAWHYQHMEDPQSTSAGSIMPAYPWLLERSVDPEDVRASVRALRKVGVPYSDADVANVPQSLATQAAAIVQNLAQGNIAAAPDREIIALIAYLQRLGVDGRRAIEAGRTARTEPQ